VPNGSVIQTSRVSTSMTHGLLVEDADVGRGGHHRRGRTTASSTWDISDATKDGVETGPAQQVCREVEPVFEPKGRPRPPRRLPLFGHQPGG
jgi:hypothetical protein